MARAYVHGRSAVSSSSGAVSSSTTPLPPVTWARRRIGASVTISPPSERSSSARVSAITWEPPRGNPQPTPCPCIASSRPAPADDSDGMAPAACATTPVKSAGATSPRKRRFQAPVPCSSDAEPEPQRRDRIARHLEQLRPGERHDPALPGEQRRDQSAPQAPVGAEPPRRCGRGRATRCRRARRRADARRTPRARSSRSGRAVRACGTPATRGRPGAPPSTRRAGIPAA